MLTEEEALHHILKRVSPLPWRMRPLQEVRNAFAATPVMATIPLPGFDNSSMDGYAVRAEDTHGSRRLPVVAEQPAGPSQDLTLAPRTAIRIFTGAPLPAQASAVIMQEDVSLHDDGRTIQCNTPVTPGENIRRAGSDLCVGQKLLAAGDRLTAARLALLASQGLVEVPASPAPQVAVVTTGDELAPGGRPLLPGQLYNSNGIMLQGLVQDCGLAPPSLHHLPDDLEATTEALRKLLDTQDLVILSGGVSVGDHDCVKAALQVLGLSPEFWRVKVKPGKPLLFVQATRSDGRPCHLFGLPGNPVSSFVTFQLFVRPALLKAMGAGDAEILPSKVSARVQSPLSNPGDRPHYVRGRLADGVFTPLGMQQSHALYGLSQANALLRMEAGEILHSEEVSSHVVVLL